MSSLLSPGRCRHVRRIPVTHRGQRWMRQSTVEIAPDSRLMLQVVRLAVAEVETGESAEQPGVSLRRHDGVMRAEFGGIEPVIRLHANLDVAIEQSALDVFGDVDPRVLQQ